MYYLVSYLVDISKIRTIYAKTVFNMKECKI
jgi:hypothetical protein